MHAIAKRLKVEAFEGGNNASHFGDGADAAIPAAAVGGPARGRHFSPDESLVSEDEPAFARFGHNTGIRFMAFDKIVGPKARVFFVSDEGCHHATANVFAGQRCDRGHHRGSAPFHVVASPSIDTVPVYGWLK